MSWFSAHFRQHGAIHALWTISVLIAVIAALILMRPDGDSVGQYIAFATSIASLVLAVVAIGQALISNQSFSETVGSLQASASNVEQAARNIAETSASLTQQSESLVGHVAKVPPAVEALTAKLEESALDKAKANASLEGFNGSQDPTTSQIYNRSRFGAQVSLYALCMSFTHKKDIELQEMLSGQTTEIWPALFLGYFLSVQAFQPCGMQVDQASGSGGYKYRVLSLGRVEPEGIISSFRRYDDGEGNILRDRIDQYFKEDFRASEGNVAPASKI